MFEWFAPLRVSRIVDHGRVFCPVQQGDVDVDRCGSCPSLARVVNGEGGLPREIVCQPSYGALIGPDTPL